VTTVTKRSISRAVCTDVLCDVDWSKRR